MSKILDNMAASHDCLPQDILTPSTAYYTPATIDLHKEHVYLLEQIRINIIFIGLRKHIIHKQTKSLHHIYTRPVFVSY